MCRSYEHFCRCGKQLDAAMAAAGAKELAPRADIHREDYPAIDAWVSLALGGLAKLSLKTLAETGGERRQACMCWSYSDVLIRV